MAMARAISLPLPHLPRLTVDHLPRISSDRSLLASSTVSATFCCPLAWRGLPLSQGVISSATTPRRCAKSDSHFTSISHFCDLKHWLVTMKNPGEGFTDEEIFEYYIKTLADALQTNEEEAKKKIYLASYMRYFVFGCNVDQATSDRLEGMPGVIAITPHFFFNSIADDRKEELPELQTNSFNQYLEKIAWKIWKDRDAKVSTAELVLYSAEKYKPLQSFITENKNGSITAVLAIEIFISYGICLRSVKGTSSRDKKIKEITLEIAGLTIAQVSAVLNSPVSRAACKEYRFFDLLAVVADALNNIIKASQG